jgi:hypothetical protein
MTRQAWDRWVEVVNRTVTTKVKHLLGTIIVAFASFGFITWQVRALQEADRQQDLREAADATYEVDLRAYDVAVIQHHQCLARIETREQVRERFIASAEAKRRLVDVVAANTNNPDSPAIADLYAVVEAELEAIDAELPSLTAAACPPQPERPSEPVDYSGES